MAKHKAWPGNKAVVDSDKLLYGVIVSIGVLGTRYTEAMHTGLLKTLLIPMHDIVGVARAEHGEFGVRHHCHQKVPPHATESQHREQAPHTTYRNAAHCFVGYVQMAKSKALSLLPIKHGREYRMNI